jgi:hypothetical protein
MAGTSTRVWARRQRFLFRSYAVVLPGVILAKAAAGGGSVVAAGVLAVLLAAVLWTGPAGMEVRTCPRGVTVRNMFRTCFVPWHLVRGFSLAEAFPWVAYLEVSEGRDLPMWGLSSEPWLHGESGRRAVVEAVDALNRALRHVAAGVGTVTSTATTRAGSSPS